MIHPRKDKNGKEVKLSNPSTPTSLSAWHDSHAIATCIPEGILPEQINQIPLQSWLDHPTIVEDWNSISGIDAKIEEPPLQKSPGKKLSAGAVVFEPDGRVWVVHPSNAFGGYKATFAKGTADKRLSLQATAIKEVFEESGLRIRITSWLGDFTRTTSVCRLYLGERIGGTPSDMGWESQAVSLTPVTELTNLLNGAADVPVIAAIQKLNINPKPYQTTEILVHGGNLARILKTLEDFYASYAAWPSHLQIHSNCLTDLVTHHLTPTGFFRLQSKIQLSVTDGREIIARDDKGHIFEYNHHQAIQNHKSVLVEAWLGL